jgi:lipopolysaccharide export system protein LptC
VWHRWFRRGLLALSLILTSFLVYLLMTRTGTAPSNTAATASLQHVDAGLDRFRFTQSRAGVVQWEVLAEHGRVFESEKRAVLDRVKVTLYGPQGRELTLEGDEGTINTANRDFMLAKRTGLIVIRLQNGYTIYTNHLTWADERREISTSDPVTISGQGMTLTGRGLVGKLDSEEFKVLEDVHLEIL